MANRHQYEAKRGMKTRQRKDKNIQGSGQGTCSPQRRREHRGLAERLIAFSLRLCGEWPSGFQTITAQLHCFLLFPVLRR
jgi:hypothetical protein